MTHRSRSEQDESGAVPGPLYLALSLCASRQSDERIEGIKQFGRLGQKGEIALGSVLRIFVNEREPVVKAEMQRVLASSGPEIIQPSLEMVDEIVQGAATELIGVLRALAGGRLEPLVRSAEGVGDEAWERVRVHWLRFEPMVDLLIEHWLSQLAELGAVLESLLIALRPVSLPILQRRLFTCNESEPRNRMLDVLYRCGERGRQCIQNLYLEGEIPLSISAAVVLTNDNRGLKWLFDFAELGSPQQRVAALQAVLVTKGERLQREIPRLFRWLRDKTPDVKLTIRRIFTGLIESREGLWDKSADFFPSHEELLESLAFADDASTNLLPTHGFMEDVQSELVIIAEMLISKLHCGCERLDTEQQASIRTAIEFRLLGVSDPTTREQLEELCQGL